MRHLYSASSVVTGIALLALTAACQHNSGDRPSQTTTTSASTSISASAPAIEELTFVDGPRLVVEKKDGGVELYETSSTTITNATLPPPSSPPPARPKNVMGVGDYPRGPVFGGGSGSGH